MKIAFNASPLLSPLTGIGQYTYHLAKGLQADSELSMHFFYAGVWSQDVRESADATQSNATWRSTLRSTVKKSIPNATRYKLSRYWRQHSFGKGCADQNIEIYHEPNFLAYRCDAPSVITVHDLSWIRYPHTHPKERVAEMNRYFQPGLERASLVLTDSEFVKQDLMDLFGTPANRIQSIPLGSEGVFHPRTKEETLTVLSQQGLSHGQYLLAVGTLEPRKNLGLALQAYRSLPAAMRQHFPLVLVGMKGWLTSALEREMAPLVAAGQIRVLGYLPREDLATVIAGALCLIYPSIYEGFGLPPLEAMASAVPVISSNVSSLPEVVGDSGVLIDPNDAQALAQAMAEMIEDTVFRNQLAQKALERSRLFSWNSCVSQTIAAYRQVLPKD
ncbi:MAG: glycosyltransferase family 1 protein [Undibacterium sp.]|uniref:glycosyltransferase family 4 protein n=1 Tax=Undibacterium sp. TaxID=1914977 RepID=UPI00271B40FB|nr:glycosyltransferase family 1 protein [Undibacterium sp.]MDO8654026.1 glycosyltransferase family 1 protein [Undibacterium sp.]